MRGFSRPGFLTAFCAWLSFGAAELSARPDIVVEGERAFSARRVADLLPLPSPLPAWHPDEWDAWSEDAALLVREGYRDAGFFDAEVAVQLLLPEGQAGVRPRRIEVQVVEGERYRFDRVHVRLPEGNYPVFDSTALAVRPERAFDKNHLFRDRRALLQFYGNAGFLRAQAAESLYYDFNDKTIDVVFRVDPGRAIVFDTLLFRIHREGDTTGLPGLTRRSVLRGLFPLDPGDTLTLRDMNTYERKLKSTRVFNFIRLRDSLSDTTAFSRSAVTLVAEERIPGEIEAAGYWETQYGFGIDLTLMQGNLRGSLQEARTGLIFAQRKQSVLAGYSSPLLFGSSYRFDNDFVVNWYQDSRLMRDAGLYDGDFDVSNQSRVSRQLAPWARGVSAAELFGKSEKIDTVSRVRDFNLNFLNSVYMQRVDNLINPSRGGKLALTWGNGGPLLDLPGTRHNWIESEASTYLPLSGWMVLALRLDGGRFFGAGGINSSRFFLGGPRSVRSRNWRDVCPVKTAEGGCVQEGIEPAYALGSIELRILPFHAATRGFAARLNELQVVPFSDYGNVWNVGDPLSESGEGRAVGIGLRYGFLALFNLRLDYARDPLDGSVSRWVVDLAQAF